MCPKSRGRPPGRGRAAKRPASTVRQLTALDRVLREAPQVRAGDRLNAQLSASEWLGAAWRARTVGQRDAEADLVRQVVAATSGPRAGAAYVALHALATIRADSWRSDVSAALANPRSGPAPLWAVDPATHGPEAPVSAQRWSDPWGSEVAYLLRFDEPVEHTLIVFETTVGGRYVQVVEVGTAGAGPGDDDGDMPLVDVDPGEALAEIADALWKTDRYWPPNGEPDYVVHRALAHWRADGHRRDVDRVPLPDDDREQLISEFIAEQDVLDDPGIVRVLADTFIDFGDGYLHGGVLAWNPGEVELFMLDWVHRKVLLEPDCTAALPEVLEAWVAFALRRRGLALEHIAPVVETVTALGEQYRDALADSSLAGPAKEIMTRLLDAGVDLHDKDAVDGAIGAYNAEQNARRLLEP